jgi:hypothetical protein
VTHLETRPRPASARRALLPPLALAVLPFLLFAPVTSMWQVFSALDVQAYFYPYHVLPARMLAEGHLPLWNPYVFSGIPLLGDGQTALFYPPNWLFFLLPGETALNLVVLIQFSIAGVGMFAFARTLGLWLVPACVAALAYMFCGCITGRVVHLSIMSGAALVPVIFACVTRLLTSDGTHWRPWCAATSVALALQAVAGHPQIPIYTAVGVALYTLVRVVEFRSGTGGWRFVSRPVLMIAASYVLGYSLAAIQLVPWIELARLSTRAAGTTYAFVFGTSTTGAEWLLFLFPYLLGAHASSMFATGSLTGAEAVRVWEHSAYIGILPLALAAAGVGHLAELTVQSRRVGQPHGDETPGSARLRHRWFSLVALGLLLLVGLLIAAGWHTPFGRLLYVLPVLGKLRAVERALVLAAFALATLSGFGLQSILERPAVRRRLLAPALLIVAIPFVVLLYAQFRGAAPLFGIPGRDLTRLSLPLPHTYVPLALAAASALVLGWWIRTPAGPSTLAIALALVLLDLGLYTTSFTATAPRRVYRVRPEVLSAWRSDRSLFRKATVARGDTDVRSAQHTLAMSWGMVHGVEDVNGFNSLQPRRYTDYVFGPNVDDVSYGRLRDERLFRADNPVLSSLNVRYLIVAAADPPLLAPHLRPIFEGGRARVYENTLAYPRAYFADRVRREPDPRRILKRVTAPGFDGRREALVEGPAAPLLPPPRGAAAADASRRAPNGLTIATTTPDARFLVVSEMYLPGWRAYVDGVETAIYRTNYLFRGVAVPAGQHTVTFVYRPVSVMIGMGISGVAVLVVGVLLSYRRGARVVEYDQGMGGTRDR